jgi:serine/alanine adding enzyme
VIAVAPFAGVPTEWDAFVRAEPEGTFAHLAGWWPIMREAFGHEPLPLEARDDRGNLIGVLPLVHVSSRLFGRYLISMPFLNAGGPLGTPEARNALAEEAEHEGRRRRVSLVELRNQGSATSWGRVTDRKITVHLPLPSDEQALWKGFPSKLRSQVRRAMKESFEIRFGAAELEAFYAVFTRNMRALGTPVLPRRVFERIFDAFPSVAECGVVYDGRTPIAGGVGFSWSGQFELTWAAALREYNARAPNMLLYWSLMQRALASGHHTFDFGRCTPGGGTHRFKRQWGGLDVPLPWTQWAPGESQAPPSPDQPIFRVASACWRRLPLAVTNRLGPIIATQLP